MNTTDYFEELDTETKAIIQNCVDGDNSSDRWKRCLTEGNRSEIFEIEGKDVILKIFLPKGARDQDIEALTDLAGIKYFPKLYAYSKKKYLFMEKAKGVSIHDLLMNGQITHEKLQIIKEQVLDAYQEMLTRKRDDHDFKFEHIFWDEESQLITWIDLGICDKLVVYYPSKEEMIENFCEYFEEKLSYYGLKI